MSKPLTHFEEGLASVIAEYVANYKFFQTDKWFELRCEFRRCGGLAHVSDLSVEEKVTL